MQVRHIQTILFTLVTALCFAQVGINTTSPNAILDVQSSNQLTPTNTDGILIPKIDEYPVTNPTTAQDGMIVYVTGNGSVSKGFYYWDDNLTTWRPFGSGVEKLSDLSDAKSDDDGSSIFIGVGAGSNDDVSDNRNVGLGFSSLFSNTSGWLNTAIGSYSLPFNTLGNANTAIGSSSLFFNTEGYSNTALGSHSLADNINGFENTAVGTSSLRYNELGIGNTAIGSQSLLNNISGSFNIAIGYNAGKNETNSNRLYIENTDSPAPLIYGEFDNDLLRINGIAEIVETTDTSLKVKTNDGNSSSLSLLEGADFGFEFLYTGSNDKLNLWSRTFAGNEAERMTWLKNGNVGIGTNAPSYTLEVNGDAAKPGGGTWIAASDRRLKDNIKDYRRGLKELLKIRPVVFNYNSKSGFNIQKSHVGVIAQDLKEILPEMVLEKASNENYLAVDNSAMTYMLINAIQEQQGLIETQNKEIEQLKKEIQLIKKLLKND